ncbi:MAG: undecaprenyl-diphosphatase UppP [Planctomycetota bacterium]|nr:undecaprenyl-diphosphatase UppP [Planctomycetota bacterium]
MSIFQAIIYGIVQGLTEFLPISSSAHLRIVPALLKWKDPGAPFTAVIQIGTLLAVLIYFRQDIVRIARASVGDLLAGQPLRTPDAKLGWMIVVATIPIVLFGLLFKDAIHTTLRSLYVISAALIILALILVVAEVYLRWRMRHGRPLRELKSAGWGDAIFIGLAQAIALIPGSSRSGVTITAGLFAGMSRETAARFSFLISLPSIFAAGVYELYKEWHALSASGIGLDNLLVATVVSGMVGYASIAFLLGYLKKHSTAIFIIYRLALGILLLWLLNAGLLAANN